MNNNYRDILIYLATPYSHVEPVIEEIREKLVTLVTKKLEQAGISVFSPITHSARLCQDGGFSGSYNTWKKTDRMYVERLDEVWVLLTPGYTESEGVQDEIAHARRHNKPVRYVSYDIVKNRIVVKDTQRKHILDHEELLVL